MTSSLVFHGKYEEYTQQEVATLGRSEYDERIEAKKQELISRFDALRRSPAQTVHESEERALRDDIEKELSLMSFEDYYREHFPRSNEG